MFKAWFSKLDKTRMKVKMMCRDPSDYVRETKKDIFKSKFI